MFNPEFPLESAMIAQGFEFTVDSSEGAHTSASGQPRKICCELKEQARARWLMENLGSTHLSSECDELGV
jgi:hypothetical protein